MSAKYRGGFLVPFAHRDGLEAGDFESEVEASDS